MCDLPHIMQGWGQQRLLSQKGWHQTASGLMGRAKMGGEEPGEDLCLVREEGGEMMARDFKMLTTNQAAKVLGKLTFRFDFKINIYSHGFQYLIL